MDKTRVKREGVELRAGERWVANSIVLHTPQRYSCRWCDRPWNEHEIEQHGGTAKCPPHIEPARNGTFESTAADSGHEPDWSRRPRQSLCTCRDASQVEIKEISIQGGHRNKWRYHYGCSRCGRYWREISRIKAPEGDN